MTFIDLIPNSPNNIVKIIWQTVRRITNEISGVKGLSLVFHGYVS